MDRQISPTWTWGGGGALDFLVSHSWKNALHTVSTQEIMALVDFTLSSPASSGYTTLEDRECDIWDFIQVFSEY